MKKLNIVDFEKIVKQIAENETTICKEGNKYNIICKLLKYENDKLLKKLLNYDLSEIPAHCWEKFSTVSLDKYFDFSKSKANIDFNYFKLGLMNYSFKECNISNLDANNLKPFLEDSFDNKTKRKFHKMFLGNKFNQEFKENYYKNFLDLDDIFRLNEEQIKELKHKDIEKHIVYLGSCDSLIKEKIGITNLALFNLNTNGYLNAPERFLSLIDHHELERIFENSTPKDSYNSFEEKIVKFLIDLNPFPGENYSKITGKFREKYTNLFISKDVPKELQEKYYRKYITINDILIYKSYISYLYNINLKNIIRTKLRIYNYKNSSSTDLFTFYLDRFGNVAALEMVLKYNVLLELDFKIENEIVIKNNKTHHILDGSKDEIDEFLEKTIYKLITYKLYSNKEIIKKIELVDDNFKRKHPDIFFEDLKIPNIDVKELYRGLIRYDYFYKNDIGLNYFKDKNLKMIFRGSNNKFAEKVMDIYGNEVFLRLCYKYGKYLYAFMASDNAIMMYFEKTSEEELYKSIDNTIIEECKNGNYKYYPGDEVIIKLCTEKHKELFISEKAPIILKTRFYNGLSISLLEGHKEYYEYLKDVYLYASLAKVYKRSEREELKKYFDLFGDKALILSILKGKTIDEAVNNGKVELMYEWYKLTGKKYIPDISIINNINIEENNKYFKNSLKWSKLLKKLPNYTTCSEDKDALVKLAYSLGIFDGNENSYNELLNLLLGIPKIINKKIYDEFREYISSYYEIVGTYKGDFLQALFISAKEDGIIINKPLDVLDILFKEMPNNLYALKIDNNKTPNLYKGLRKILIRYTSIKLIDDTNIHSLFSGFKITYDKEFKEFLLKNINELLNMKSITSEEDLEEEEITIAMIQNRFEEIKRINCNRTITLDLVKNCIHMIKYDNVFLHNEAVAEYSSIAGYNQNDFEKIENIYTFGRQRINSSIPRITGTYNDYTYEILKLTDPLALVIGTLTNCCQEIGNLAESCMIHSAVCPDGRIFVIRDKEDKIVSQSWVWRNKDLVCFDNIEISNRAFRRSESEYRLTKDVFEIYKKASIELIEKEQNELNNLYKKGKIDYETLKNISINKVTVGLGYNDIANMIENNLSIDKISQKPKEFKMPIEMDKCLYISDSRTQYVIIDNNKNTSYDAPYLFHDKANILDYNTLTFKDLYYINSFKEYEIYYYGNMNPMDALSNEYNTNSKNTKVIIDANFIIIYEENEDIIKLVDILYLTNTNYINNDREICNIDIEDIVIKQIEYALNDLNKEIDISNLEEEKRNILKKILAKKDNKKILIKNIEV